MTVFATLLASPSVLARLCRRCTEHLPNGPNGGYGPVTWPLTKWLVIDWDMFSPRYLTLEADVVEIQRFGLLHVLIGTGFAGDTADLTGAQSSTNPAR